MSDAYGPNQCSVCEKPVKGQCGIVPVYFCPRCFAEHRGPILTREPWTQWLLNQERQRRKRRNSLHKKQGLPKLVSLSRLEGYNL